MHRHDGRPTAERFGLMNDGKRKTVTGGPADPLELRRGPTLACVVAGQGVPSNHSS
jgi:hypothetical protein